LKSSSSLCVTVGFCGVENQEICCKLLILWLLR
jgi:hypothetical protein